MILDTCFETDTNLDLKALRLFSEQAAELSRDVSDIIRFMNLPRGPHPVVFSAPPGTLALPEQDPIDVDKKIAPMARRLVLTAQAAEAKGEALNTSELVRALTVNDENFGTSPGVTWFDGSFESASILTPGSGARASMERRRGTAFSAHVCCQEGASGSKPDGETANWAVEGQVAFRPEGEDYVTGGEPFEARFESDEATVWELTQKSFDIGVHLDDGRWFSLALSVPGSVFAPGVFSRAQRHASAEADRPGMSVSIEGSECNEVAGAFELTAVRTDKDGALRTLAAELRQICDEGPGALVGSAELSFTPAR